MSFAANRRQAFRSVLPLPVSGMASTCLIYLGCWYLGRRGAILSGRLSASVVFSTNSTIASPNPGCGIAVIAKVTEIIERRVSSIDSICTFIPPVLMVLSFLPRMVKVPSGCISARSFVTKVSSQTNGAWITSVFSGDKHSFTDEKGVYADEASGPFSLRRAICDKVSVIP